MTNDTIFKEKKEGIDDIVDLIQLRTWHWIKANSKDVLFSIHD